MNDTVVAQLHRTLVDALRRSRPGSLHRPVTVAEIYQDLVPYRAARERVGFEMNADYEHALLRLLAGEGDLARVEPREVRDKLRMELDSPNPNVGIFRNYAACDVWVSMEGVEEPGDDAAGEEYETQDEITEEASSWENEFVGPEDAAQEDESEIDTIDVELEEAAHATPFEIATDTVAEAEADEPVHAPESMVPVVCGFCNADLPADRIVNFCPFCGHDQSQQPCPGCGEMLDPLWRFCVQCGTRVRPLGDHIN